MGSLFLAVYLLSFSNAVFCVHIFKLGYRVTPEQSVNSPDYDSIIFISSHPYNDSNIPARIQDALAEATKGGASLPAEGSVLAVELRAKRMICVPTDLYGGDAPNEFTYRDMTKDEEYQDIWKFREAAKKAIERVLKEKFQAPLLVLQPLQNPKFPHAELVTLLGALEALYMNIKDREGIDKGPKLKNLGVWHPDYSTVLDIVNLACNFEDGRIVARDIADAGPERMSPPRVEEYVREVFTPKSGINISVVSEPEVLKKEYPLFSAVSGAGRIILLTYESQTPRVDTVLLVGQGNSAGAVAGFMKVLSETRVGGLKVVAALAVTGEAAAADAVISARSGVRVRAHSTASTADLLCYMRELVEKTEAELDPYIISLSSCHKQAVTTGPAISIVLENGPSAKNEEGITLKLNGDKLGEPLNLGELRKEDFESVKGADVIQSSSSPGQSPAAFLILASGLDKHGVDSKLPIKFSHVDVAGDVSAPVLALANRFIMRLEDPLQESFH